MKQRKTPLRRCVGCLQMYDKRELLRVVKNESGEVSLDFTGKKPGRGAYICKNKGCFAKMRKNKGLDRAFKSSVGKDVYETIENFADSNSILT